MFRARGRWSAVVGAAAAASIATATSAAAATPPTATGPSTVTPPYVVPVAPGVTITSLLSVDDAGKASNGYEMVGIPDGLCARRTGDTVTVFMNHELSASQGIVRRHGQQGAFVSELTLNPQTNEVVTGRDLINPGVQYWDYLTGSYSATPNGAGTQGDGDVFPAYDPRFGRFCSGRLTEPGQLFNFLTLTGYPGQLYFANEEIGDEGRNFAVTTDGQATQLPRLGLFSWENTLPAANRSNTTLVMGNEDGGEGQLRAYVGTKQRTGSPIEQAGLTNGRNFVADLVDETVSNDAQFRAKFGKGTPARFDLSEIDWDQSGKDQNADALVQGLSLNRIEDSAFDPRRPNDYYFVTTAGGNGPGGGLWRLRWDNIENPAAGGTLTLLLDGSEGLVSPDNVDIDSKGNLVIQEARVTTHTWPGLWPTGSVMVRWARWPPSTRLSSLQGHPDSSPRTRNPAASSMRPGSTARRRWLACPSSLFKSWRPAVSSICLTSPGPRAPSCSTLRSILRRPTTSPSMWSAVS
jgi:hypothetical protein